MAPMQSKVADELDFIDELLRTVRPEEAQERVRGLIVSFGPEELRIWEQDLRQTIGRFHKKRRNQLTEELDRRLRATNETPPEPYEEPAAPLTSPSPNLHTTPLRPSPQQPDATSGKAPESLEDDVAERLADLSKNHIFQWSNYYRGAVFGIFERSHASLDTNTGLDSIAEILRRQFTDHTKEIFSKGYLYKTSTDGIPDYDARRISLSGLQKFLDLPLEAYAAHISKGRSPSLIAVSRLLASSIISGIIAGYAQVPFGDRAGANLLPSYPRYWLNFLPFLCPPDLRLVLSALASTDLADQLDEVLLPLLEAIQEFNDGPGQGFAVPVLSQYLSEMSRLDFALRPHPLGGDDRLFEVNCYIDSSLVPTYSLEDSARRSIGLIVIPFRADLHDWVSKNERLKDTVVFVAIDKEGPSEKDSRNRARLRLRQAMELSLYRQRSPRVSSAPLTHNFAREFPLDNPLLRPFYHVRRPSVRGLMQTFEHRTGVRCWCSVRRSGKTTACFDLASLTGLSTVVSQTCDSTWQLPGSNDFYSAVLDAIDSGCRIPDDFLEVVVRRCAGEERLDVDRFILVLDEYETLFGRLDSAVEASREVRYNVVQPLLNQMAAFSGANLIVLLGQMPNAHLILPEQNQLSPYVRQDAFPLFAHDGGNAEEFGELLHKVFGELVWFNADFANAAYRETAGHPYLTVQLLIVLLDWLIERAIRICDLRLDESLFAEFASHRLTPKRVLQTEEYSLFRGWAKGAVSRRGRQDDPWLWAIYSVLRSLVRENPADLSCTRSDFELICDGLSIEEDDLVPGDLLVAGQQANFLEFDDDQVRPRIRLLCKIAG